MTLKKKGTPYWKRPDLGVGRDDVTVKGNTVSVVVHSLGSVNAPECTIALVDGSGKVVSKTDVPPLRALLGFQPVTHTAKLHLPPGTSVQDLNVVIDPLTEITRMNNSVSLD